MADLTRSINRMCAQLKEMQQTIQQSERARLLAQLAAGLAHQLRNSLTGARLSVQLHAKRHPAPAGDETLTVAFGSSRSPRSRSKGCSRSAGSSGSRPRFATCASSWRMSPSWSIRRASTPRSTSRSPPRMGRIRSSSWPIRSGLRAAILNLALNAIEAAGRGGTVAWKSIGRRTK